MGQLNVFRHDPSGVTGWVTYADNNQRIGGAFWNNPTALNGLVRIWVDGQLFEQVLAPGSGNVNITGNYRVQQIQTDDGPVWALPSNVTYQFSWPA